MLNKRISDLKRAEENDNGCYVNGNHSVDLIKGCYPPTRYTCSGCELSMKCLLAGHQITHEEARKENRGCYTRRRFVIFRYHGSTCLQLDRHLDTLQDFGYWGYSVTTSRAIRWYLEALAERGYIAPMHIEPAIKHFKQRKAKDRQVYICH